MSVKHYLLTALFALALTAGQAIAQSVVVNIDWNSGSADATYVGDDGILSTVGGTVWNGLDAGATGPFLDLDDEFGNETPVWVRHINPSGGYGEPFSSTNAMQTAGYSGEGVIIAGLLPGVPYDIAIYMGNNSGVFSGFTSASGTETVAFGSPTYVLPGVANSDYFLITRFATLVTNDDYGFTIDGFDGQILGMQIEGVVPEPASVGLLALGGLAMLRRR